MNKIKNQKTENKKSEHHFFQALVHNSPYAVVQLDKDHRVAAVNPNFEKLFGYKSAEIIGGNVDEFLATESLLSDAEEITQSVTSGALVRKVSQRKKKDGSLIDVEIFAVPVTVGEEIIGAFGLYLDISEQVKTEKALRESEARYRSVTQAASDAIIIIDLMGKITTWNKGAREIFGYSDSEVLGKTLDILMPNEYYNGHKVGLDRVNSDGEKRVIGKTVELEGVRKNGEIFPLELCVSTWDVDGRKQYGGIIRDITERKQAEKKLRFMSYHDSLTGLYNRGYFDEEMARLDKSRQYPVSIIVCDMDDLKQINDTFGHNVGDIAIKGAAKILSSVFRSEDVVARIGGDEFAIIVPRYDINKNISILNRLQKNIASYNENKLEDGLYRPIALSIGYSLVLEGESLIEGYKRADKHMYIVKAQKKGK